MDNDATIPRRPIIPRRRASADVRARTNRGRTRSHASRAALTQSLRQMLADLPTACDVGCKKNSRAQRDLDRIQTPHRRGLRRIPVSCVLTSASVHDSQVAIP